MRILFCGDAFPAARPRLARLIRPDDELAVCPRDDIGAALDGVDMVIPFMCRIDSSVWSTGSQVTVSLCSTRWCAPGWVISWRVA